MSDESTYSYSGPICPYCKHEHEHDGGYFYNEDLTETECESCGKTFSISVGNWWSWTCEPMANELESPPHED
jgi:transposase-like protein